MRQQIARSLKKSEMTVICLIKKANECINFDIQYTQNTKKLKKVKLKSKLIINSLLNAKKPVGNLWFIAKQLDSQ